MYQRGGERKKGRSPVLASPSVQLVGVSRVLGLRNNPALEEYVYLDSFFHTLELGFLLSMQMSYHAQSISLDLSGTGSEGFGALGLSWPLLYSPCLVLDLIPALELHCVVLISKIQKKDICLRKVLPYLLSHILFFLTACHYWQSLAGPTAICLLVFETFTSAPLSLRLLHTSSGDYCWSQETDFVGIGLLCDVGIPNAWAGFWGYVLNLWQPSTGDVHHPCLLYPVGLYKRESAGWGR